MLLTSFRVGVLLFLSVFFLRSVVAWDSLSGRLRRRRGVEKETDRARGKEREREREKGKRPLEGRPSQKEKKNETRRIVRLVFQSLAFAVPFCVVSPLFFLFSCCFVLCGSNATKTNAVRGKPKNLFKKTSEKEMDAGAKRGNENRKKKKESNRERTKPKMKNETDECEGEEGNEKETVDGRS